MFESNHKKFQELVGFLAGKVDRITEIEPKNKNQMLMKLMEEFGELSRANLRNEGALNYRKDNDSYVEELIDVLMVAVSMLSRHMSDNDIKDGELYKLISHKCEKWLLSIVAVTDREGIPKPDGTSLVPMNSVTNKVAKLHLESWMIGQTAQLSPSGETMIYPWDYTSWYNAYMLNKSAEVHD